MIAPWGNDANLFYQEDSQCCGPRCDEHQWELAGLPLCLTHASETATVVRQMLDTAFPFDLNDVAPQLQSYVYYLMLSPESVKIGTTMRLEQRIVDGLYSELQYVVALEKGGREVEHQRHKQVLW